MALKLYLFRKGDVMYQTQRQTTRPQITAHLAQTMTLLTKTVEELNEEIEKELALNPALEINEELHCPTCNRIIPRNGFCPNCTKPRSMSADETVVFISPRNDFISRSANNDEDVPDEDLDDEPDEDPDEDPDEYDPLEPEPEEPLLYDEEDLLPEDELL